jgi:hypothetical protein
MSGIKSEIYRDGDKAKKHTNWLQATFHILRNIVFNTPIIKFGLKFQKIASSRTHSIWIKKEMRMPFNKTTEIIWKESLCANNEGYFITQWLCFFFIIVDINYASQIRSRRLTTNPQQNWPSKHLVKGTAFAVELLYLQRSGNRLIYPLFYHNVIFQKFENITIWKDK